MKNALRKFGPVESKFSSSSLNFNFAPAMTTTLRRATSDDAAILSHISYVTFEQTWDFFYTPEILKQYLEENYSEEAIRRELLDPDVMNFLAFVDGELAGFMKLSRKQTLAYWITDRCIELCRIYVYKKFQDQKVGKLLMEKAIEVAKEEGMESIVLGVWENNHKAVKFYTGFGFEQIGTHPFIVGTQVDTDWVMRKRV